MRRKTSGRSYLQQLAQPVAPGTTVLAARPVSPAHATETTSLIPAIEDSFDMPDGARSTWTRGPARLPSPIMDPIPSPLAIESADRPASSHTTARLMANDSPRLSMHNPPRANVTRQEQLPPVAPHIENASTAASTPPAVRSPRGRSAREERFIEEQPTRSEPKRAAESRESQTLRPREFSRSEPPRVEERPVPPSLEVRSAAGMEFTSVRDSIAASSTAKHAPSSQSARHDTFTQRTESQRMAEPVSTAPRSLQTAAKAEKPEVRSSDGPRVHIGTVEIRAVLPPPIVPQPAAVAQSVAQNIAAAQARGRSGPAEPLARGLEWSYGLVQG